MNNDLTTRGGEKPYAGLADNFKENRFYLFVKRAFDIVFSAVMIILLFPLMLLTALLVKLDGGPAFYIQERVGKNGKHFMIYKFRSMIKNADDPDILKEVQKLNEMDGPMFKSAVDPRITKVGRVIRKLSIDELPQLFNVLIGNMSIVGPRPPLQSEVDMFTDYQKQKLLVKQGITCYWQCSGRNNIKFEEWIDLDLKYIKECGILTDLKIILKTVPAVLSTKGAN